MRHFENLAEQLAQKATVRDVVKLHPETVQKAEEVAKRVRKPRRIVRKPKVIIETVKVDPEVMKVALDLANGDHSRLTIEKSGAVIVWNNPRTNKPQDNR